MPTICLWGTSFLIAPLLALLTYLWWQARIKPLPYQDMFAVKEHAESQIDQRFVALDGLMNCRDIGGYTNTEGKQMVWGKIYRSDDLSRVTDDDLLTLQHDLGLKTVVDLRSTKESRRHPNRLPAGSMYRHIPIFETDPVNVGLLFVRHRLDRIFKWHYREAIIDEGATALGQVLKLTADLANLPLLMHCTSGKDRTGVATALLLYLCGIPRAAIVSDYTLTNRTAEHYLEAIQGTIRRLPIARLLTVEQLYPILSARAGLIEHVFDHIEATYGSVDAYLLGPVGLTPADMAAIRANLLIDA